MLSASLYIIVCSARNRIRVRLRRLREPRYLLGAIAGVAYFYFAVFARMRGGRPRSGRRRTGDGPDGPPEEVVAAFTAAGPALAGLALLFLSAAVWLLPTASGLLAFTEAEIQFLFPAPVTRRQLLMHRILRSQIGILFTSLVVSIFVPAASGGSRLRLSIAMWVMLTTGKVYFTGVSLARMRVAAASPGERRAAWMPIAVLAAAITIVGGALVRAFAGQPVGNPSDAIARIEAVAFSGASGLVLAPFVALARPMFASEPATFAVGLAAAVVVLAATVAWVLRTDQAFEEAATAASARQAAARQARIAPAPTARDVRWTLPLTGRTEVLFLWKNAMQLLRTTSGIALVRYLVPLAVIAVSIGSTMMSRGAAMTLCSVGVGVAAFSVLLGPQIMRADLRDDLRHLELLKTWPLRPSDVVRGEMLLPGVVLTGIAWLAVGCAAILSAAGFPRLSFAWRSSGAIAAFVVAPALVFAQLTVHNAAAVLFPAWVPTGHSRPRGLDAIGQRLIMLGAVMLTLVVMLAPGVLAGAILWFVFYRVLGAAVLIPGALACLAIVTLEVLAVTEALGPAYERLDIMAVERSE